MNIMWNQNMKPLRNSLLCAVLLVLALPSFAAPKYAAWTARLIPADARAGEGAQIVLTATIQKPWHVYSLTQPAGGPNKTTLELLPGSPLVAAGKGVQPPPKKEHDSGFNMTVELYEGTVSFGLPVTIKPGVAGKQTARVKVKYQLCNNNSCLPPDKEEIAVSFAVAKGAARASHKSPVTTVPKAKLAANVPAYEGTLILAGGPQDSAPGGNAAPAQGGDVFAEKIQQAQHQGLLSFLWFSIGAGFLALLTPCVFPMIPITVSFFTKRKDEGGAKGVSGAFAYCIGIVGTFTGLGLLMTVLFGASGIAKFATNPYVNIGLAVLFILLAANLLGAFEIAVPAGLANKVQSGNSQRTGLVQPLLMGLTFTLTSFTCTAPFVGTLLVTATRGSFFYPLVGMLAFSSAFALPFFLLALFPQYLGRLPKSGSWLVTVKAYMGMLEIAAALKFLSNADLVWQRGLLTRPVFLATWAIIGVIAGLYLLGWLQLPKDISAPRIGWGRRFVGIGTAGVGVYCLAAINGASLGEFDAFVPPSPYPGHESAAIVKSGTATSAAPAPWLDTYEKAVAQAKAENKLVLINFTGVTCTNCRWMEKNMFPLPEVTKETDQYVKVELYTDRDTPADDKNKELEEKLTGVVTLPVYVAVTPDGKVQKVFQGLTRDPAEFVKFLQQGRGAATAMTL